MLNRILEMPVSTAIIFVWIVVWILVLTNKNIIQVFCGKGISNIGKEYYRLFSAGLTHKSIIHLIANVCAMFWIGYLYEDYIGSIKFLLIGLFCNIAAQALFMFVYRDVTESIGGSGYNFALCGFGLTMQLFEPDFPKITLGTWSGNWIVVSLIGGNIPGLSFMNITTVLFHMFAFVLGACAALLCRSLRI